MKEAEIKYIQVKGHQDEIQVLLLLRRYTHTLHTIKKTAGSGCSTSQDACLKHVLGEATGDFSYGGFIMW